ncbi:MAG: GIY-YIG nuclease family protein [Leptolyngbyaceae cyanobacterium CSU_1_4]|nr:GIY-YIG nuclease family protein [Leptolyngbyaceae cyanobacterium CSU_1_4]
METNNLIPIEHQNVPQAHQGLHGFLYSSDDEHGALAPTEAKAGLSAEVIVPLTDWCESVGTAKIAGVYSVLNRDRQTQYIGYSRNVALALRGHLAQLGQDICALVRVQPFDFPKRNDMEALQNRWIAELDTVPPGNESDRSLWATTVGAAAIAAMSEAERQAYDEKKLKLRKAMAESDLNRELLVNEGEGDRAENLEAAVTQDDWSQVVQQQTQETLPNL